MEVEDLLGESAGALWPLDDPDERTYAHGGATQRVWSLSADHQHTAVGLVVWRGALALCRHLLPPAPAQPTHTASGLAVIELGAGPGLVGVACATAGVARTVLMTDYDASVLELLRRNREANAEAARAAGCARLEVAALDWTAPVGPERAGAYDVAVASDVTYCRELVGPLLRTAAAVLRAGGLLVMANGRTRSHEDEACRAAAAAGLRKAYERAVSLGEDGGLEDQDAQRPSCNPSDVVIITAYLKPLDE
eukprot:m51a1_g4203 hypothetical protein (251) ;mRNA; f:14500-15252